MKLEDYDIIKELIRREDTCPCVSCVAMRSMRTIIGCFSATEIALVQRKIRLGVHSTEMRELIAECKRTCEAFSEMVLETFRPYWTIGCTQPWPATPVKEA